MKEVIVVCLILMDPRKKKLSTRYHENDKETQMELGWSCGEKNRQLLDNPHLITFWNGTPRGHVHNRNRRRSRTRWRDDLDRLAKHWHRVASSRVQ